MAIKLFHQCGHNAVWSRESFSSDDCGDGLILSPVHQNKSVIEDLPRDIKVRSFFDPQFYLPNSQKPKLATYDFFPEVISDGFETADFGLRALDAAKKCLDFQVENEFCRVVIPARHFSDMLPDYTDRQDAYTVHPFLQAINERQYQGDVFLTVPMTAAMVTHEGYRSGLLNWITSYPELSGVYLLVEDNRSTKQIQDVGFLMAYMQIVKELVDVGLKVTVGHTNTEGLLFTLIEGCEITFGAYENTRMFSIDKFVVTDEERRGPKARLYIAGLLNWLQYSQAKQVQHEMPELWENAYKATKYGDEALAAAREPHFGNPSLYKHFFLNYESQVRALELLDAERRWELLRGWLLDARNFYDEINSLPIDLDKHGSGGHIQPWLDSANWYKRNYLG